MSRTPGFIDPSAYSSPEMVAEKLQELNKEFGFTPLGEEFMHSADVVHYGVKGMHWGQRKAQLPMHRQYKARNREADKATFGQRGVNRINKRMHAGKTYKQALVREFALGAGKSAIAAGALAGAAILRNNGGLLAQSVAKKAQTNRGRAQAAATMGLPRKPTNGPTFAKKNRRGVHNISSL